MKKQSQNLIQTLMLLLQANVIYDSIFPAQFVTNILVAKQT